MRTTNSLKNIITTLIPYMIIGLLGFLKVKVFVGGLSEDIYSLNQLFYQIMSYLALADAGFGVIIVQKMYKSFITNDRDEINNLYSTLKIFFRRIGYFMIVASIILSFFIDIFANVSVDKTYIQIIFIIFVFRNSLDYFLSTPRYIIQADQKMYKINILVNLIKIIENSVEIILVLMGVDYLYVLLPGIGINILFNYIINQKIYKLYPWITYTKKYNKEYLKDKYVLISQKLSGIFYSNTDIILISSIINPVAVIIYTSYNYISKFITDLVFMIASAITPSYANIINNKNEENKFEVFEELNIVFYFIASFISVTLYVLFNNFISLWVGEEYLIDLFGLFLFIFITYRNISVRPIYILINSLGLFKESNKAILLEAFLNFTLSIILIFSMGINGVLLGTVISTMITTFLYFPYYIYKNVFEEKPRKYFIKYFACLLITIALITIIKIIGIPSMNSIFIWLLYAVIYSLVTLILLYTIYMIIFKSFRKVNDRIMYLLRKFKGVVVK